MSDLMADLREAAVDPLNGIIAFIDKQQAKRLLALLEAGRACRDALAKLEVDALIQRGNELGEDFMECDECERHEWGSVDAYDAGDMYHNEKCPFVAVGRYDEAAK